MLSAAVLAVAAVGQNLLHPTPQVWSRDEGAASLAHDPSQTVEGASPFRLVHTRAQDWGIALADPIPVEPGAVLKLHSSIRVRGEGSARLCFVIRRGEQVVDWAAGGALIEQASDWRRFESTVVAARGVTTLQPRLIGWGRATVWFSRPVLARRQVALPKEEELKPILLENKQLRVSLNPADLSTSIIDKRTGKTWRQCPAEPLPVLSAKAARDKADLELLGPDAETRIRVSVSVDGQKPDLTWRISGTGALDKELAIPGPLAAEAKDEHIIPLNMGFALPADDKEVGEMWLSGFGGHGLSMAFYGQLSQGAGALTIIDRSDDILVALKRRDGIFEASPLWIPEKGRFGYPRQVRLTFFDKADHNALAFAYRAHAQKIGLHKTLAEKAKSNPLVRQVARSANLWSWDGGVDLAKDVASAGFKNVLWSGGGNPEGLKEIRSLGFLVSRYDIYQDLMRPEVLPRLPWLHPDWTQAAWPDKVVRDRHGNWVKGWVVKDKDGKDEPCAVCCDLEAIPFAKERISKELETHPYQARFIDTTTAADYRECYDPRHPMTRGESRKARMQLLQLVTDMGLVAGSETGHEASVPHLVYYEGMMSLGPFRVDDAGTDPPKIYDQLPDKVIKHQLGFRMRIPLWQLVYGDCTASTWYWGDFNNKHLPTWKIRDLWNILYGTPPMYFTGREFFKQHREEFMRSYRETQQGLQATAMQRMVKHVNLMPDRSVQQTQWGNGARITVNFGDKPQLGIPPLGYRIEPGRRG